MWRRRSRRGGRRTEAVDPVAGGDDPMSKEESDEQDGDRVGLESEAGRAIGQLRLDNRLPVNTCLIAGGRRHLLDVARNSSGLRIFSMQGEPVA